MPLTPVYGLPYEARGDQPLHSLTGGSSGTEPILAEAVETELVRVDDELSDVQAQLGRGWVTIVREEVTEATTFDISSGVYDMIWVQLRGGLDGTGRVALRVNADTTAGLHRFGWITLDPSSPGVADGNSGDATLWPVAEWSTSAGNIATAILLGTDVSSQLCYEGSGVRVAASTALRIRTLSGGNLSANRLLSSLRVLGTGANLATCRVWIMGHRP